MNAEQSPDFPEDVARIVQILAERGHTLTDEQADALWTAHSQEHMAGWLVLPSDAEVASAVLVQMSKGEKQ